MEGVQLTEPLTAEEIDTVERVYHEQGDYEALALVATIRWLEVDLNTAVELLEACHGDYSYAGTEDVEGFLRRIRSRSSRPDLAELRALWEAATAQSAMRFRADEVVTAQAVLIRVVPALLDEIERLRTPLGRWGIWKGVGAQAIWKDGTLNIEIGDIRKDWPGKIESTIEP